MNYQWLEDCLRTGEKVSEDSYILSVDTGRNKRSKVTAENDPEHKSADRLIIEDPSQQKKIKTCPADSKTARSEETHKISVDSLDHSPKSDAASGLSHSSRSLSPEVTSLSSDGQERAVSSCPFPQRVAFKS